MFSQKKIIKLKSENKALKETCEVLSDKKIMKSIKQSLSDIKKGHYITPSDLKNA